MNARINLAAYFILITLIFISHHSFSQSTLDSKKIVVGIPGISGKEIVKIYSQINTLEGIKVTGYCEELKCLLMNYDSSWYPDEIIVLNNLITLFPNTEIYLKSDSDEALIRKNYKVTNFFERENNK